MEDCWRAYGEQGDARSDAGEAIVDKIDCSQRVLRGGSWDNTAARVRSAQRSGGAPRAAIRSSVSVWREIDSRPFARRGGANDDRTMIVDATFGKRYWYYR